MKAPPHIVLRRIRIHVKFVHVIFANLEDSGKILATEQISKFDKSQKHQVNK